MVLKLEKQFRKVLSSLHGKMFFGLLQLGSQVTLGHYEMKLKVKMSFSSTETVIEHVWVDENDILTFNFIS